ncbi:MAG TPA: AmmeMemoRadiSam system protein B [Candidatus Acidoferrales bacterium]|nr:AmmeMemoRadiSam system protein B [Candidatus Acidoferrales bacterium]
MSTVREPAVAGQFYPGSRDVLSREVHSFTAVKGEKLRARGCVVPHAGYMYSGHVAGALYARLELPKRYIILCPNHTGWGKPLAILSEGRWRTPLGDAEVDTELAESLKNGFSLLQEDEQAHLREHALEVQLPFLQLLAPGFRFVPITVGIGQFEVLSALGVVLAKAIAAANDDVMIIASSDMNHYESDQKTRIKDSLALEKVLSLDAHGLFDTVQREHITMCGYGPTVAMLTAALRLGAHHAELIKYATSGDVSGDREHVVGYAAVAII